MYTKKFQLCINKIVKQKKDQYEESMTAVAALMISAVSFAQSTWTLDKSHASLGFRLPT